MVERDQLAVPLEGREPVAAHAEPRPVLPGEGVAVAGEIGADVVEHAVEQDPQTAPAGLGDQVVEVVVVAEPRIDAVVVDGVVAVRLRREHRPERDTRRAEFEGVVEPVAIRRSRCSSAVGGGSAGNAPTKPSG